MRSGIAAVAAAVLSTGVGLSTGAASADEATKIELGRRLFYEADLSVNGTMSCATCHVQKHGFADGNRTHPGALGHPGRRNVPGLANVGRFRNLTWAKDLPGGLERQALDPLTGTAPIEMAIGGIEGEVMDRLARDPCYARLFAASFADYATKPTMTQVTAAIAAFERTMVAEESDWDRATKAGAPLADAAAERGRVLFVERGCATCHVPPLFTDDAFHVVRGSFEGEYDEGLFETTGKPADRFAFRTTPLRDVAMTGPYWHDGRATTLSQAIRLHDAPGLVPTLSETDRAEIAAFLGSLTDRRLASDPKLAMPPAACPLP